MIVNQKFIPVLKKMMLTATAVAALIRCTEEEITPAATPVATASAAESSAPQELLLSSLTITGINTIFTSSKDCNCSYTVPGDQQLIDGKELGITPGSTICLEANVKYGDLEFINMEGTEEDPILIVNRGVSASDLLEAETQSVSAQDPY